MSDSERISIIHLVHNSIGITRQCMDALADAVADLDHEVVLLDTR